jgi:hypothetical protein
LYWRIENFPSLDQAKAAASAYVWNPDTVSYRGLPSLVADIAGKAWLFTLGPRGGATAGGTKVGEIGPVPAIAAPEYLLRVNEGSGPPGAETPIHAHPGSEAFYVVAGRLGQRTPGGTNYIETGHTMNGHQPGMPMQVFNGGTTELTAIILFVVDATQPFSVPAKFEWGGLEADRSGIAARGLRFLGELWDASHPCACVLRQHCYLYHGKHCVMDPLLGIVILGAFAFAGLMGCLGNWRSSSRHKSWPSRTRTYNGADFGFGDRVEIFRSIGAFPALLRSLPRVRGEVAGLGSVGRLIGKISCMYVASMPQ